MVSLYFLRRISLACVIASLKSLPNSPSPMGRWRIFNSRELGIILILYTCKPFITMMVVMALQISLSRLANRILRSVTSSLFGLFLMHIVFGGELLPILYPLCHSPHERYSTLFIFLRKIFASNLSLAPQCRSFEFLHNLLHRYLLAIFSGIRWMDGEYSILVNWELLPLYTVIVREAMDGSLTPDSGRYEE